ncbi:MAG: AAA family ATPase [Bacillota bacterium]|nr:AAA family ATPase [Bacillota bacterium]
MLDNPSVTLDGAAVNFPYRKAEGLFYYICIKKSITREEAISVFWASCDAKAAKKNLRDAVYTVRKLLGDDLLDVTGNSGIRLNANARIEIDTDGLTKDNIRKKYKGDFLSFFYIKDCLEFESWAEELRSGYKNMYYRNLQERLGEMTDEKKLEEIREYSSVLIKNDIYNEDIYRYLMRVYARSGDYNSAIKLFQSLSDVLKTDLEEVPAEETVKLYKDILKLKGVEPKRKDGAFYIERFSITYQISVHLNAFRTGYATSVLLCGEAGIGKSDLLARARKLIDTEQFIALSHSCCRAEKDVYLQPWYDLLAQLLSCEREGVITLMPAQKQMIEALFPKLMTDSIAMRGIIMEASRVEMMSEAILNVFIHHVQKKKIILIFDDIQWMDSISKRLLSAILFQLGNQNIMMIAACRDENEKELADFIVPLFEKERLVEVRIPRLTLDETRKAVTEYLPELGNEDKFVSELYGKTEGNPLYLMELIKQIKDGGDMDKIPMRVVHVIKSLLMNLPENEMKLLEIISLFSDGSNMEKMKICMPQPELEIYMLLENLIERNLLIEAASGGNVHYLISRGSVRDYVYGQMSAAKKRMMHHNIAGYYEACFLDTRDRAYYPLILEHYKNSGDAYKTYVYNVRYLLDLCTPYHDTFPNLEGAIPSAMARRKIPVCEEELFRLSQEIRSLKDDTEEIAGIKIDMPFILGRFLIFIGRYEQGIINLRECIGLAQKANDYKKLLHAYYQMIRFGALVNNVEMMKDFIDRCVPIIKKNDYLSEMSFVMCMESLYCIKEKRYNEAIDILWSALDLHKKYNASKDCYPIGVAICYNYLGECHYNKGEYELSLRYFEQAVCVCSADYLINGYGIFFANAGKALYAMQEYGEAEKYFTRSIGYFDEAGALCGKEVPLAFMALLLIRKGCGKKAFSYYSEAKEISEAFRDQDSLPVIGEAAQSLSAL